MFQNEANYQQTTSYKPSLLMILHKDAIPEGFIRKPHVSTVENLHPCTTKILAVIKKYYHLNAYNCTHLQQ